MKKLLIGLSVFIFIALIVTVINIVPNQDLGGQTVETGTIKIKTLSNSLLAVDSVGNIISTTTPVMAESDPIATAAGYITSSALSPYLSIASAAETYQPIGSYLTSISGLNISLLNNDAG
jgi:hypothetical protein